MAQIILADGTKKQIDIHSSNWDSVGKALCQNSRYGRTSGVKLILTESEERLLNGKRHLQVGHLIGDQMLAERRKTQKCYKRISWSYLSREFRVEGLVDVAA